MFNLGLLNFATQFKNGNKIEIIQLSESYDICVHLNDKMVGNLAPLQFINFFVNVAENTPYLYDFMHNKGKVYFLEAKSFTIKVDCVIASTISIVENKLNPNTVLVWIFNKTNIPYGTLTPEELAHLFKKEIIEPLKMQQERMKLPETNQQYSILFYNKFNLLVTVEGPTNLDNAIEYVIQRLEDSGNKNASNFKNDLINQRRVQDCYGNAYQIMSINPLLKKA